jgi:hypothetical protein
MYSAYYEAKRRAAKLPYTDTANSFTKTNYFTSINDCLEFDTERQFRLSTTPMECTLSTPTMRRNSKHAYYMSDKSLTVCDVASGACVKQLGIQTDGTCWDFYVTEDWVYILIDQCVVQMSTTDYSATTLTLSYVPEGAYHICGYDESSGFALTTGTGMYLYDAKGTFLGAGGSSSGCQGHFLYKDNAVWTILMHTPGVFTLYTCPIGTDTTAYSKGTGITVDGLSTSRLCDYDASHIILCGAPNQYLLFNTSTHSYTTHTMKSYSAYFTRPYDEDAVIAYDTTGYEMIKGTGRTRFYEELETSVFTYPHYGYVSGTPNAFTDPLTVTSASIVDKPTGQCSAKFTSIECPSLMEKIELMIDAKLPATQ